MYLQVHFSESGRIVTTEMHPAEQLASLGHFVCLDLSHHSGPRHHLK